MTSSASGAAGAFAADAAVLCYGSLLSVHGTAGVLVATETGKISFSTAVTVSSVAAFEIIPAADFSAGGGGGGVGSVSSSRRVIRCGDAVSLRHAATGLFVAAQAVGPNLTGAQSSALELTPTVNDGAVWTLLSAGGLLAAAASRTNGIPELVAPVAPRPDLTVNAPIIFMSHSGGGDGVAAATRLRLLTASGGGGGSSLLRQPCVETADVATARGGSSAVGSARTPASALYAIALAPPRDASWALVPMRADGRGAGPLAPPLSLQPGGAVARDTDAAPLFASSASIAAASAAAAASGPSSHADALAITNATEAALLAATFDALRGVPSAFLVRRISPSARVAIDWDAATCPALADAAVDGAKEWGVSANSRSTLDAALVAGVEAICPVADAASRARAWVARRGAASGTGGAVAHAAAAAVDSILKEFGLLLASLERSPSVSPSRAAAPPTLAALAFSLRGASRTLSTLDAILNDAAWATGGALVDVFSSWARGAGDSGARAVAGLLAARSAAPLLATLRNWLAAGDVDDAWGEFFVVENVSVSAPRLRDGGSGGGDADAWWRSRFSLEAARVPAVLATHAAAVLAAGKAVAVLRACHESATAGEGAGTGVGAAVIAAAAAARAADAAASAAAHAPPVVRSIADLRGPRRDAALGGDRRSSLGAAVIDGSSGGRATHAVTGAFSAAGSGGAASVTSPRRASMSSVGSVSAVSVTSLSPSPRGQHTASSAAVSVAGPTGSVLDAALLSLHQARRGNQETAASDADRPAAGLSNARALTVVTASAAGSVVTTSAASLSRGARSSSVSPPAPSTHAAASALVTPPPPPLIARASPLVRVALPCVPPVIQFSLDPNDYTATIAAAAAFASAQLLALLYASGPAASGGAYGVLRGDGEGDGGGDGGGDDDDESVAAAEGFSVAGSVGVGGGGTGTALALCATLPPLGETWAGQGALGHPGDVLGRLNTLRRFFLCASGDWVSAFIESAAAELSLDVGAPSPKRGASFARLRALFDTAARSSAVSGDAYAKDVAPTLARSSLLAEVEGVVPAAAGAAPPVLAAHALFSLSFAAPWPSSLLLTRNALAAYSRLFRHVFALRVAERAVAESWSAHQSCKGLAGLRVVLAKAFALRHRMALLLRALVFYFTAEVLEPAWRDLAYSLRSATTLDAASAAHDAFLHAAAARCLLHSPELLRTLTKLARLCLLFSAQLTRAIEDHRLSEAALDARAGVNLAGARAREQRDRGAFRIDAIDDAASVASVVPPPIVATGDVEGSGDWALRPRGTAAPRSRAAPRLAPGAAARDARLRRAERSAAQADALRSVLAQPQWQALIQKSAGMFDSLSVDFLTALAAAARGGSAGSSLGSLLQRLDFTGYYERRAGSAPR